MSPELWEGMAPREQEFATLELSGSRTPGYYERRLAALGFAQLDALVDVGCGIGQWAIAAAGINKSVEASDISDERLRIAGELAAAHDVSNIRFQRAPMEELPLPAAAGDAVFCYGAFMFAPMRAALTEFCRVLRPGGRLYLNANALGWYLHLLIDRGLRQHQRGMARAVAHALRQTVLGRDQARVVSARWLRRRLSDAGFRVIELGAEGSIHRVEHDPPPPLYPARFWGRRALIEILAEAP